MANQNEEFVAIIKAAISMYLLLAFFTFIITNISIEGSLLIFLFPFIINFCTRRAQQEAVAFLCFIFSCLFFLHIFFLLTMGSRDAYFYKYYLGLESNENWHIRLLYVPLIFCGMNIVRRLL